MVKKPIMAMKELKDQEERSAYLREKIGWSDLLEGYSF
jgi:hypothetical protein